MKLRCLPEDFVVEELPTIAPQSDGPYTLYRLTKRGLGTLEAVEAIKRRWQIESSRISYGGLKDRHAFTTQWLSIHRGPRRGLKQTNLELAPLGHAARPYTPACFAGNRFAITLRDMDEASLERAERGLRAVQRDGLPNYFDDQRFGSVGFDGGFIGEAWLRGDHEGALRLALAEPNAHDRPETRAEKMILRDQWGRWSEAKARLPRSHARSLVTYLVDHPSDFRGAFARLNRNLRSLYFSAYQSFLWNSVLGRLIERATRPEQRVAIAFRMARLPMVQGLDDAQRVRLHACRIPLPAARAPLPEGELGELCSAVLAERGLTWTDLRVRHLKDVFFSKGERAAFAFARELSWSVADDELYPGRWRLTLVFQLGKGSYATILVKCLTELEPEDAAPSDDENQ